jgi:hypothetical protein
MPNTYVRKAEREREALIRKSVQTLLAICDDPTASPETKLGAVKQLRSIQELQEQLSIKDEQLSHKDEDASGLERQLEQKSKALEAVEKQLQAALEGNKCYETKIDVLETDNKKLADERTDCDKRLTTIEREKSAAIDRAKNAEAVAEGLIGSLKILADEFVPAQQRHSTALRQFKAYGPKLSNHWYGLLDFSNAIRHEIEHKKLRELIVEARKQERPLGPGLVYVTPDDAEFFGAIFLYWLLVQRDKWLEKSLIDFFRSEGADYSKWLSWDNGEASATNGEIERKRFLRARQDYHIALKQGSPWFPLHSQ